MTVVDARTEDLELAAGLVREAGRLAARMLAEGLETRHKTSISDVVSDADQACEKLITERLAEQRPDDGLVGEEGARRPGHRTWYIDPVDGTYNFLSKLAIWCSAVGLTDDDGLVLGAVYHPVADELWVGGRGHPTTCNGVPVELLTDVSLAKVSIGSYLPPHRLTADRIDGIRPLLNAISAAATVRVIGSGSIELASVAGGRIGASLHAGTLPWDWVPGAALVEAAGGATEKVTVAGRDYFVAGNRQAVQEIRAALLSA
ncbi:inositol monophosphatase family protein [Microlunatus elymi]|uniref:Inositol monophosphatase family protein n=1 Tax=Microlunatus elymi TaxID=2596828 RepID=A0A516PZB6_9ACTN|nr:inositol monophosphatase family protein [Microlunatus elymi]QDP96519.1 inositol monophosphatase family protein [Microlunatus elymi]